ncbi:MAG: hypothetical protein HC882_03040 [Acidobacteria bacterium]|nr:hypothetical protein [Acidobacteriota bacterium]
MADWKSPMRADPSEWLVLHSCTPIRYRVLTELHSLTIADPNIAKLRTDLLKWAPAKAHLRYQRQDGTWGGKIHSGNTKDAERTTERVLWEFYELTWDREIKEVRKSAKLLKTYLTQKKEMPLYEFKTQVKQDPVRERLVIWFLRTVTLGLLARGGWTAERKVMEAVEDLLFRVSAFVSDPVSKSPVEHVGVGLPLFKRDALDSGYCFIPDTHILRVFAHSPELLESIRFRTMLKKVFDYVMSEDYQELGEDLGAIRTVRGPIPRGWGIRLYPIEHYLEQGNLDELLFLLELFARLGLINRYPLLMGYVDWLLAQQEKDGRWDLPTKYFGQKALYNSWMRLEKDWKSGDRRIADVTFRVMVVLKYQWERQVKMLGRGSDLYGF